MAQRHTYAGTNADTRTNCDTFTFTSTSTFSFTYADAGIHGDRLPDQPADSLGRYQHARHKRDSQRKRGH